MNQLNTPKTDNTAQTKPAAPIALLDCGQASKVTKGTPFFVLFEMAPPPFDRALIW